MNQTMSLPINTEERLKGVIDLVFDKVGQVTYET